MSVSPDRNKLVRPAAEWSKIISVLTQNVPVMISVRNTDHEYRTDDRDITSWRGKAMMIPVDSLAHNVETDAPFLRELLSVYYQLQDAMGN